MQLLSPKSRLESYIRKFALEFRTQQDLPSLRQTYLSQLNQRLRLDIRYERTEQCQVGTGSKPHYIPHDLENHLMKDWRPAALSPSRHRQ